MKLTVAALWIVALVLNSVAGEPATSGNWGSVSGIAPGSEVRVTLASGKTLRGSLEATTSHSLTLNVGTGQEVLEWADVQRVQLRRRGRRLRNALVGLGIGACVGLATGIGVDSSHARDPITIVPNAGVVILTPAGAIAGTVLGAAWPTGGWRDIYRGP